MSEVVVSLKFSSAAEAAAFLSGQGGSAAGATVETATATTGKGSKGGKTVKATETEAPKFDKVKALAETTEVLNGLLKDPATGKAVSNAAERQAHVVSLIAKHGGTGKAGTIPDAKYPAFLQELIDYAASVVNDDAAGATQESLI